LIGRYNVMHSREISHQGTSLDVSYLIDLGPQALPAIDCFNALSGWKNPTLSNYRDQFASRLASELASWRSWSFRSWRLMHT
ncbi:UNVERIFIED_CONTAM: DUF4173 domain-containing protein, partial [Bacteroidetes bacterium 56_B9]